MDSSPQLSETQQIVLNLSPFASTILSILGSSGIIYLALQRRKLRQWTPYTRLLVAMSSCDILFTIAISTAFFFRPKETSEMMWAFGNDATCVATAFTLQATTAGIWYQAMLSIYFWLTARYGMKNEEIAKKIEPFMHLLSLGFPICTAIVGGVMGIYGERVGAVPCYITHHYNVLFVFYAIPAVLIGLCLIFTQSSIYLFVRSNVRKSSCQDETARSTTSLNLDVSIESSGQSISGPGSAESDQARIATSSNISSSTERNEMKRLRGRETKLTSQAQRLQLVCSQAFLYVVAFGLCQALNVTMSVLQRKSETKSDEMEVIVNHYALAVLQKILLPIQGLFNFLVYIRPRFMLLRRKFPDEGRLSTLKRIFQNHQLQPRPVKKQKLGATYEITPSQQHDFAQNGDALVRETNNLDPNATPHSMPRNMMSSITISDFDALADELLGDEDTHASHGIPSDPALGVKRISTLEVISELSQSMFELTPYQVNGSHLSVELSIPSGPSESRWKGSETSNTSATAQETKRSLGVDSSPEAPTRKSISPIGVPKRTVDASSLTDAPIRPPVRTSDAPIDVGVIVNSRANAPNNTSLEIKSQRAADQKIGQSGKRGRICDVPLVLPERFQSLPPSEVEDV